MPCSLRPRCAGEGRIDPGQMGSAFGTSSTSGETRRGLRVSLSRARRWLGAALLGAALGCQPPLARSLAPTEPSSRAPTAPVHFTGRSGSGVSSSESAQDDRLGSIRARLEALGSNIMIFWKAHGLDREHGGIYGFHDRRGTPKEDADKGLIQQTRHLWSFSTWYARREKTPEIKATADSIYGFLNDHFLDRKDGEFFYKVSARRQQGHRPEEATLRRELRDLGAGDVRRGLRCGAGRAASDGLLQIDRPTHA